MSLTASAEWAALKGHHEETKKLHMRDLFAKDSDRFKKFRLAKVTIAIATRIPSNRTLYYKCHTSIGTRFLAHANPVVKDCI